MFTNVYIYIKYKIIIPAASEEEDLELVPAASEEEEKLFIKPILTHKQWKGINAQIEDKLKTEQAIANINHADHILLISTKSSGNSTLLRQLNDIYNSTEIPQNITQQIRQQCINNAIKICKMVGDTKIQKQLAKLSISNPNDLPKIANIISTLWQNKNVKQKYFYKHIDIQYGTQIMPNMDYYFDKINEIMSDTYIANDNEDIIRCKPVYKPLKESTILVNKWNTQFIDVPTSLIRNGRMKKLHMFADARAIVFIVSLTDFCVWRDDIKDNALKYAMRCFENIINNKHTQNMDVILYFNKYDMFFEQIKRGIPLSLCFDVDNDKWDPCKNYGNVKIISVVNYMVRNVCNEYGLRKIPIGIVQWIQRYVIVEYNDIEHDHQMVDKYCTMAMHFIKDKFEELNKNKDRIIHFNALDFIDKQSVKRVMWDMQNVLYRKMI